jgi:hypothetical protein
VTRDALEQVVAQYKAILEVVDVGDIYRNAFVVDYGKVAVGGRLAEPDLEQIGGFRIGDADRERLIGVSDSYVFHLDDLR